MVEQAPSHPEKGSRDQFLALLDSGERVERQAASRLFSGLNLEGLNNNFPSLGSSLSRAQAQGNDLRLQFFHQGRHSLRSNSFLLGFLGIKSMLKQVLLQYDRQ